MELPANVQNQLVQFQQLQQQLQIVILQRQQVESQIKDIKKALEEMEKSPSEEVYKMSGGILVKRNKKEVEKELKER